MALTNYGYRIRKVTYASGSSKFLLEKKELEGWSTLHRYSAEYEAVNKLQDYLGDIEVTSILIKEV